MDKASSMNWTSADGKRWSAAIKFADALRLRETQSIDLLDPKSVGTLFGADPLVRVEAMSELARTQWTEEGLVYSDFAECLLSGETTFAEATCALRVALSDFFRRLDRNDLAVVADRAWAAMGAEQKIRDSAASGKKVGQVLDAAVARGERELNAELDRVLEEIQTLGQPSGSSPAPVDSTGDH